MNYELLRCVWLQTCNVMLWLSVSQPLCTSLCAEVRNAWAHVVLST